MKIGINADLFFITSHWCHKTLLLIIGLLFLDTEIYVQIGL